MFAATELQISRFSNFKSDVDRQFRHLRHIIDINIDELWNKRGKRSLKDFEEIFTTSCT